MSIQGSNSSAPNTNTNTNRYTYDVFLSFRGEDTRRIFTTTLYDALRRNGINAFIDDKKLPKGNRISPTLLKAIEKSRLSVVVFSENYANSTWCLDELVKIVECNKEKNQPLCPVFYKVEPEDVRLQRKSYAVALAGLEDRFRGDVEDRVSRWRLALSQAASFSGWHFQDGIGEISKQYRGLVRLQQTLLSEILEETKIKLISVDEGISKIKHRLYRKRVLLVLDDVDEIEQLEKLVGGCDWFGPGSRIIITTRDKHLLIAHHVERIYQMKGLNDQDSLELFSWYAFNMSQPASNYEAMSNYVVSYAQGLPLVLKVIGSNLTRKSLETWKSTLKQYESIPERKIQDILKISYNSLEDNAKCIFLDIACFFKRSPLEFVEDILDASGFGARFYIEVLVDKSLITVSELGFLCMHDLIQEMGREIVRLEAPSKPGQRSRLWFHDDIVRVLHENSGSNNVEGMMLDPPQEEEVEWNGIAFAKMKNLRILIVRNTHFSAGPKYLPNTLRLLDWKGYPSMSLPHDFYPRKIVVFKLSRSLFRLQEPLKRFEYVTDMYFSCCEFITKIPDVSGAPNLRELVVRGCPNLSKIHDSVGSLSRLIQLDVSGCTKLRTFPREIQMTSLQMLDISNCKSLNYFPNILGKMDALKTILAGDSGIKELPHSIGNLSGLELLDMNSCKCLRHLPSTLFTLQNLCWLLMGDSRPRSRKSFRKSMEEDHTAVIGRPNLQFLNLENCRMLDEDLHLLLNSFSNLQELFLSGNDFVSLPGCIKECTNLLELDLTGCKRLRDIPDLPSNLKIIKAENCTSLTAESSSRLWYQATNEIRDLLLKMPERPIPHWFDHSCKGRTVSFSARGKFPTVAIAFVLGHVNENSENYERECHVEVKLCINGRQIHKNNSSSLLQCPIMEGHVLLWDLRQIFREQDWNGLDASLIHDWNDVEIHGLCDSPDLTVSNSGVYVYKQQVNLEDVQFKSPNSNKSKRVLMTCKTIARYMLKRRVGFCHQYEPPKKLMRKCKSKDEGKYNMQTRKRRTRRSNKVENASQPRD